MANVNCALRMKNGQLKHLGMDIPDEAIDSLVNGSIAISIEGVDYTMVPGPSAEIFKKQRNLPSSLCLSFVECEVKKDVSSDDLIGIYRSQFVEAIDNYETEAERIAFASGMLIVLSAIRVRDSGSIPYQVAVMHTSLRGLCDERGWSVGKE